MSGIRVGAKDPVAIFWGERPVSAVYHGSRLIWPDGILIAVPLNRMFLTDFAPAVAAGASVAVPLNSIVWSDFAPSIEIFDQGVVPVDPMTWTDFAPVIAAGAHVEAPADAAVWTDFAPSISISVVVAAPADALDWTDYAPVVVSGAALEVPSDETVWGDYAPGVSAGVNIAVPVDLLAWRDFGVVAGYGFSTGFSSGFNALPSAAGASVPVDALAWTDYAPTIDAEAAATREYRGSKTSGNSTSITHTFAACDVGAPASGRRVFHSIIFYSGSSRTVVGATSGGVSADYIQQRRADMGGGYNLYAVLISAPLDSGSTADVVITLNSSASLQLKGCGTYKVMGLSSITPVAATDAGYSTYGGAKSLAVDVLQGGLLFDVMMAMGGTSVDYSYISGAVTDADEPMNANHSLVCGSMELAVDELGRTVSIDVSAGTFRGARVLASFR